MQICSVISCNFKARLGVSDARCRGEAPPRNLPAAAQFPPHVWSQLGLQLRSRWVLDPPAPQDPQPPPVPMALCHCPIQPQALSPPLSPAASWRLLPPQPRSGVLGWVWKIPEGGLGAQCWWHERVRTFPGPRPQRRHTVSHILLPCSPSMAEGWQGEEPHRELVGEESQQLAPGTPGQGPVSVPHHQSLKHWGDWEEIPDQRVAGRATCA